MNGPHAVPQTGFRIPADLKAAAKAKASQPDEPGRLQPGQPGNLNAVVVALLRGYVDGTVQVPR